MDVSRRLLSTRKELVSRRKRPQLGAMVEAAYGRPPGQNFFEDRFSPFFTAGVRLQWVTWDWGKGGRERAALDAEADVIDAREEAFTQALRAAAARQAGDVERIAALLDQDEEIILLRERITAQAASRLANGVITATEYISVRNAEQRSRLALETHRIRLAQARAMLETNNLTDPP
jgi:outer membrane protein TolC